MHNYKIKFTKKPNTENLDNDAIFEKLDYYWCVLSNNGQVIGGFDVFSDNGKMFLTTVLPEEAFLSDRYNNEYHKKTLSRDFRLFRRGVHSRR